MKIVFTGDDQYFVGLHTSCILMGIETIIWMPQHKPVFDMMHEQKPDILFIKSSHFHPVIAQAVQEYKVKVVLLGKPVESLPMLPDLWCIPDDAVKYSPQDILYDCNKMILGKGANIAEIRNGIHTDKWDTDILYLASENVPNAEPLFNLLHEACHNSDYKFRCYGLTYFPLPSYIGTVAVTEWSNLIKSAKVVIDFNASILFDVAANQGFCLSSVESPLYPNFTNLESLKQQLDLYINNEKERRTISKQAYNVVMDGHTYVHRLGAVLGNMGIDVTDTVETTLNKVRI